MCLVSSQITRSKLVNLNLKSVESLKTLVFTSTKAYSEGQSIAAEIAVMIARNRKRVVLLDADFHRPSVHQLFNLPNRVGMADVLLGKHPLSSVIHSVDNNHLFIITAGIKNNGKTNLIASQKMSEILLHLENSFDKVIIHGPPLFHSETAALAAKVNGVVLLIYPTTRGRSDSSNALLEKIQKSGAKMIGIVMRYQPNYQASQSAFIDKLLTYDRHARLSPKPSQ